MDDIRTTTVTIENDDDESTEAQLLPGDGRLIALITDGDFVDCDITFEVSMDGDDFFPLFDEDAEYTVGAEDETYHRVDERVFFGVRHIVLHTSLAQNAGDTDITLVMWKL